MVRIEQNVILKDYTTLQVGGPAEYFAVVTSEKELDEAVGHAQQEGLAVTVLGGGSNMLVSDEGVDGLVVKMDINPELVQEAGEGTVLVTAGAGMEFDDLVARSVQQGLWGLENLSHIPGSVGATPVQNVGAYGVEVKDVITHVRVYDTLARKFEVFTASECQFGYRDSFFKTPEGKHYVIVSVTYRLCQDPLPKLIYKDLAALFEGTKPALSEIRDAVIEIRSKKFPNWKTVGTAGSFFKNPIILREQFVKLQEQYPEMPYYEVDATRVKIPLAWILDKVLYLKGEGTTKVGQYAGQALVLINKGAATATEIAEHANSLTAKVKEKTGIDVQWEVTKIGF